MDFFNILKCSVFFVLIKLQEEFPPVKYHLCWICTSNKNKAFLSCHYGFANCFEILNFVFSNIITRGVSTCKILTFQDQCFQKYKAQKIVKFSFLAFLADFFKNFAPKTYGTLKIFLLSAQNNFYITLGLYVEGHVKKKNQV